MTSSVYTKRLIIWSIIGTGISSITVQLLTIREFLTQFHGNEITISLVLFSWLILTGIGSLAAKIYKPASLTLYSLLLLLIALWPLPQILFIRYFREIVFIHGASPGFYQIFLYILATLILYCLLVGFILPYALKVLKTLSQGFTSGELYMLDNIGDIFGGALFSFFFVYWLKPFKTIAITSSLLLLTGIILLVQSRKIALLIGAGLLTLLFCAYSMNTQFERSSLSKQYGEIIRYIESPYGRVIITQEGPQHTFWESGRPLYSNVDVVTSEEKTHYPLSQLERVEKVLLVSGGLGETLDEISKYNPQQIDYVELDPYLTEAAVDLGFVKKFPFLRIINLDARRFIKETDQVYDAIIIDLPDPDTFQLNRFFTSEFFSLAKRVLKEKGVLSFGMEYSPNYVSEIRKQKLSTAYNTAIMHFQNVTILPGEEAYFLCRDGKIWTDIPIRLSMKSISTDYIHGFYSGDVTRERIKQFYEGLNRDETINTDFKPRMMNIIFKEWFFKHGTSPRPFLLISLAVIAGYLLSMKKQEYVLFTTGVCTMGVEMLIIFIFQVIYGYIYLRIGAIVTVFLLGLLPGAAAGSLYSKKKPPQLIISEIIQLSLLLLFLSWYIIGADTLNQSYFLIYCFVFSFFCGFQFPVATKIIGEKRNPAAGCLAADLLGAAVGTLFVGTLTIPLWGIQTTIILLIFVKITSSVIIFITGRQHCQV